MNVSLCVCTYRRPVGLRRLLDAAARVHTERVRRLEIVIVDNDPDGSARSTVDSIEGMPFIVRYVHEPRRGISFARNRAVAEAMVHGPQAGLDLLATVRIDERVSGAHRFGSVRAHLLEMAGDMAEAREAYRRAARQTSSIPERRHLLARAARLDASDSAP